MTEEGHIVSDNYVDFSVYSTHNMCTKARYFHKNAGHYLIRLTRNAPSLEHLLEYLEMY